MSIVFFLSVHGLVFAKDHDTEPRQSIVSRFSENLESFTRPVFTGEEKEEGLFSTQWGSAHIRLSMLRGFELTLDDHPFTMKTGGRIYLDTVHYFEDQNSLGNTGLGLRTIQLNVGGKLSQDWRYRFSLAGFTNGGRVDTSGVQLDDAYFRYLGFDGVVLTIGQHTEPFSLEQRTSGLNVTFMERALPNAFAPGSTLGISAAMGGENWFATGGLYSLQLSEYKDQGSLGDGLTGYVSFDPFRSEDIDLHLGSSFSYRRVTREKDIFFRYRPESGITDVRYVNTGVIGGAKALIRWGIDVVGVAGPFSIQGEYIGTEVVRDNDFRDVGFHGWYVFLSWFPTGESRNYLENGVIGGIRPIHKYGAVELAVRFSGIDLTDKDIKGGSEQNVTVGLNWYIHPQLRIMLNYIHVNVDRFANDNGTVIGNDSPHILQLRCQGHF